MTQNGSRAQKGEGSLVDVIYNALFRAILAQQLLPGTKLSEETIGAHFKVSRTMVRAALNRLHTESLVELRQNRGAFVSSLTIEDARQVFDARICIEREVFSRLAVMHTDKQLQMLQNHLEQEGAAHKKDDYGASILLSGEFHLMAARMAGNSVFVDFLNSLISSSSLILAQFSRHHESECSADEHTKIIQALQTRDPKLAALAIEGHLNGVVQRTNIGEIERPQRSLGEILSLYTDI